MSLTKKVLHKKHLDKCGNNNSIGGISSWNDLSDKPFYDYPYRVNGDKANSEILVEVSASVGYYYAGDNTPSDDLGNYILYIGDEECFATNVVFNANNVLYYTNKNTIFPYAIKTTKDNVTITINNKTISLSKTGLYLFYYPSGDRVVTALTAGQLKFIDSKYIEGATIIPINKKGDDSITAEEFCALKAGFYFIHNKLSIKFIDEQDNITDTTIWGLICKFAGDYYVDCYTLGVCYWINKDTIDGVKCLVSTEIYPIADTNIMATKEYVDEAVENNKQVQANWSQNDNTQSDYIKNKPQTVSSVNGKSGAVTLNYSDVNALPNTTTIPSKLSELDNDKKFVNKTELEESIVECQKSFMKAPVKVHFPFKGYDTGDCTIIETENNVIMIDCGEKVANVSGSKSSIDVLIEYLVANNLTKIDYFMVSHFHTDHLGAGSSSVPYGLQTLFADSRINTTTTKFLLPHKDINYSSFLGYSNSTPTAKTLESKVKELCTGNRSYRYPENNEELIVDDCIFTFHNIGSKYYDEYYAETAGTMNEATSKTIYNNFSMVVQMSHGNNKFLFTGDIQQKAQKLIADVIKNPDVVKIEHHGLNYTSHDDYLKVIAPKYTVVMEYEVHIDGDTERRETFNKCRLTGTVFSSNLNGNIVITSENNTLTAISEKGNTNESHIRTLDSGKGLNYNEDLNGRTEVGEFFSWGTNLTSTLKNCLVKEGGFKLIVERLVVGNKSGIRQTIIVDGEYDGVAYSRIQYDYGSNNWSPWSCESPFAKGINLSKSVDLNDCLDNVTYRTSDGTVSASLLNAPSGLDSKIKIINHALGSSDVKQIILTSNSANQVFYTRYAHRTDSSKNSSWYKFEGTKV